MRSSRSLRRIDRELAARPQLVAIETAWRHAEEQRPGALHKHQYRELAQPENLDAEPPCEATRAAIVVFGKETGRLLTVCTDLQCPVHDPREVARRATEPATPQLRPAPRPETEEEAEQRRAEHEQQRKEYEAEQARKAEERRQEIELEEGEYQAEEARREEQRQTREVTYRRVLENAPAAFSAAQLRVLLRALVHLDPYTLADELAEELSEEQDSRSMEEALLAALDTTADDKLTGFALRLALSAHRGIPRQNEPDLLAEADAAFAPIQKPRPKPKTAKVTKTAPVLPKKASAAKKKAAA